MHRMVGRWMSKISYQFKQRVTRQYSLSKTANRIPLHFLGLHRTQFHSEMRNTVFQVTLGNLEIQFLPMQSERNAYIHNITQLRPEFRACKYKV